MEEFKKNKRFQLLYNCYLLLMYGHNKIVEELLFVNDDID